MKSHISPSYSGTYYTPLFKEIKRELKPAPMFYCCRQCQCKIDGTPRYQYWAGNHWEAICSTCARVVGELYGYQSIRENPAWKAEHREEEVEA